MKMLLRKQIEDFFDAIWLEVITSSKALVESDLRHEIEEDIELTVDDAVGGEGKTRGSYDL